MQALITHTTAVLIGISIGIAATVWAALYILDPDKSAVTYILKVDEND